MVVFQPFFPVESIQYSEGVAAGETGEPQLLRELQPDSYDLVLEVQSDEERLANHDVTRCVGWVQSAIQG